LSRFFCPGSVQHGPSPSPQLGRPIDRHDVPHCHTLIVFSRHKLRLGCPAQRLEHIAGVCSSGRCGPSSPTLARASSRQRLRGSATHANIERHTCPCNAPLTIPSNRFACALMRCNLPIPQVAAYHQYYAPVRAPWTDAAGACRRRPEPLASSRPQLELASLFADRSQPLVATQAAPAATTGARDLNLKRALACSLHGNPGSVLASDAAPSDNGLEVLLLGVVDGPIPACPRPMGLLHH
jgi:hypothetical protein